MIPIMSVEIRFEHDVVNARQRARKLAELLGFDNQEQVRIATTVSEIARNAFTYAGGGRADFQLEGKTTPQIFQIRISDRGPGIKNIESILDGNYKSRTGMGLGILGARRLMDQFEIDTAPGKGTTILLRKLLPKSARLFTASDLGKVAEELARQRSNSPLEEVELQNRELIRALDELRRRQDELSHLNRELEDTNRGVVALYAELDEKADHLKRADELKTRFLSNMSHEFRTPLNSTLAIAQLLLNRTDGELTPEQEKQVGYIHKGAETLLGLVNDLLDLAKIEAGKVVIRPVHFEISNLFSALRGMLRPLLVSESVDLIFEPTTHIPTIFSDEAKISQILRNFISNALKFTEKGSIRVSAELTADGKAVTFAVADTGIGIAPEFHDKLFKEFSQVEHALQKKVRGSGLGLQLSKKLAEVLGGGVAVKSALGEGSTFSATIPLFYIEPGPVGGKPIEAAIDPSREQILLVEDDLATIEIYQSYLKHSPFQILAAQSIHNARRVLAATKPKALILDIMLKGEDTWRFIAELKADGKTKSIPILIASSVEDQAKAQALGADGYLVKPVDKDVLLRELNEFTGQSTSQNTLLLIEDDEAARYVLISQLKSEYNVLTAVNGREGIDKAVKFRPKAILLDLDLPDITGYSVLTTLAKNEVTHDIPVIIHSAAVLSLADRELLLRNATAIVPKDSMSSNSSRILLDAALRAAGVRAVDAPAIKVTV